MLSIIAIFSAIMIVQESFKVWYEGLKFFDNAQNSLNILSILLIIIAGVNRYQLGEDFYESDFSETVMLFAVILLALRGLSQLRIFYQFQIAFKLVQSTLIDLIYFVGICSMILVVFASVNGLQKVKGESDGAGQLAGVNMDMNSSLYEQSMQLIEMPVQNISAL